MPTKALCRHEVGRQAKGKDWENRRVLLVVVHKMKAEQEAHSERVKASKRTEREHEGEGVRLGAGHPGGKIQGLADG